MSDNGFYAAFVNRAVCETSILPKPPLLGYACPMATDESPDSPKRSKPSGIVLSVHLPPKTVLLLRRLAAARQAAAGSGKASVSAVLVDLVEANRDELEGEVERLEGEL